MLLQKIFIVLNNKTEEGYIDCFKYIREYIQRLNKYIKTTIKIKTFTTDFEIGLYNLFDKVFNSGNDIRHIGCYFHYLQNIRKYLQKNGFTTK